MSQKVQKYKNTNELSKMFGKYYVRAVYDKKFITTDELADYIQMQASVKRSDCKAVLDELGMAMKHYFELGQKVKKSRVLFAPETTSTPTGETATVQRPALVNGVPTVVDYEVNTYSHPATMLKDVRFELAQNATGSGITPSGDDSGGGDGGDDEPRP